MIFGTILMISLVSWWIVNGMQKAALFNLSWIQNKTIKILNFKSQTPGLWLYVWFWILDNNNRHVKLNKDEIST